MINRPFLLFLKAKQGSRSLFRLSSRALRKTW